MVSILAFYSDNSSSNLGVFQNFPHEKTKRNVKRHQGWPIFKNKQNANVDKSLIGVKFHSAHLDLNPRQTVGRHHHRPDQTKVLRGNPNLRCRTCVEHNSSENFLILGFLISQHVRSNRTQEGRCHNNDYHTQRLCYRLGEVLQETAEGNSWE